MDRIRKKIETEIVECLYPFFPETSVFSIAQRIIRLDSIKELIEIADSGFLIEALKEKIKELEGVKSWIQFVKEA